VSASEILPADAPEWIPAVRELFEEYAAQLGVDLCFQNFAEELATLPGAYAPPRGGVWIARVDGRDAGCVALRPLREGDAELKRLYVRAAFRGYGLGLRLTRTALDFARAAGYRRVLLDTLPEMTEAQALYRHLGFKPVPEYAPHPVPGTIWMELAFEDAQA
jgi:GNAT superfamily N-acetyltransferase